MLLVDTQLPCIYVDLRLLPRDFLHAVMEACTGSSSSHIDVHYPGTCIWEVHDGCDHEDD